MSSSMSTMLYVRRTKRVCERSKETDIHIYRYSFKVKKSVRREILRDVKNEKKRKYIRQTYQLTNKHMHHGSSHDLLIDEHLLGCLERDEQGEIRKRQSRSERE